MPTLTWAVDVALWPWRKSTQSGGAQQCVELARQPARAAIRDSKNRDNALLFNRHAFDVFLSAVKAERSDA